MSIVVVGAEIFLGAGIFLMLAMLHAGISEKEWRAAWLSSIGAALLSVFGVLLWIFRSGAAEAASWMIIISGILFLFVSLIPAMPKAEVIDLFHALRYDERDHMFSRANLSSFPELREVHHRNHPEHRSCDLELDRLPALGEAGGRCYDPILSPE